jgi:hypothetical protein
VQDNPAVYLLPAIPVRLESQVIDDQVCPRGPCKGDEGRDHLDCRTDGIDDIRSPVKRQVGLEDIIDRERNRPRGEVFDIGCP